MKTKAEVAAWEANSRRSTRGQLLGPPVGNVPSLRSSAPASSHVRSSSSYTDCNSVRINAALNDSAPSLRSSQSARFSSDTYFSQAASSWGTSLGNFEEQKKSISESHFKSENIPQKDMQQEFDLLQNKWKKLSDENKQLGKLMIEEQNSLGKIEQQRFDLKNQSLAELTSLRNQLSTLKLQLAGSRHNSVSEALEENKVAMCRDSKGDVGSLITLLENSEAELACLKETYKSNKLKHERKIAESKLQLKNTLERERFIDRKMSQNPPKRSTKKSKRKWGIF